MLRLRAVLVVSVLLLLAGCSAAPRAAKEGSASSRGIFTSGRVSTQQGTFHYIRELHLLRDGTVREARIYEATEKFATMLTDSYDTIAQGAPGFSYTQSERDGLYRIRGETLHKSMAAFNQVGGSAIHLVEWPIFRSVSVTGKVGALDDNALLGMFPAGPNVKQDDWTRFLREAVHLSVVVNDEVTGLSRQWTRSAGQVGGGATVAVATKEWRAPAVYGAVGVGAAVLVLMYLGLFGRRHWDPNRE